MFSSTAATIKVFLNYRKNKQLTMKKFKTLPVLITILSLSYQSNAQSSTLERITRLNYLNPALKMELPTSKNTLFAASVGFGFNPVYENNRSLIANNSTGWTYMFNSFINAEQLIYVNHNKRIAKGKNMANNSGNFFKINARMNGPEVYSTVDRNSNFNFQFSVLYGIKRAFGKNSKFHYEFAFGLAAYNINTLGQSNWDPFVLQFNIGQKL